MTPIDNRPRLIKRDVNYTQIVVDRTRALDGTVYDIMFVSTGGFRPLVRTLAPLALPWGASACPRGPNCVRGSVPKWPPQLAGLRAVSTSDHRGAG